jgi:putative ABC transport system permease protein
MKIFSGNKNTRFFQRVNITGLAIGLAASIMLILFVVNELSYDRHFDGHERIVRLINTVESDGSTRKIAITQQKAFLEAVQKTSGIEAATQTYDMGQPELVYEKQRYQRINTLFADTSFFSVFKMKFLAGTPQQALKDINSVAITSKQAVNIFGTVANAMGKTFTMMERDYTVAAVVEALPMNTHFTFDVIGNLRSLPFYDDMQGLEYMSYIKINKEAPFERVRADLEREYSQGAKEFSERLNWKLSGSTERLDDIYLHSNALYSRGKSNDMKFVWMLIIIALVILLLAVMNFINLFTAQCEARMLEIGIRKTYGASVKDIVKQFFGEVSGVVGVAFVAGMLLTLFLTPFFAKLINREIDMQQLLNPQFIICTVALFAFTVTASATYPAFYTTRFTPLDILAKRLLFSKRRLTTALIVFQSIITIVLISFILVINRQTTYLKSLPTNYDMKNVMFVPANRTIVNNYEAIRAELLNTGGVEEVSAGGHIVGGGWSGQNITTFEAPDNYRAINEYRILPGVCELMRLQLVEGEFLREDAPDSLNFIVLNEAACKMLGLKPPYAGQTVLYKEVEAMITGVVKDFIYGSPSRAVDPLVLTTMNAGVANLYIRFNPTMSRSKANEIVSDVIHRFDTDIIINHFWSEDEYNTKFDYVELQFRIVLTGSLLSVFIAMIGLLATHLYTARRRTKEIGVRRINGATVKNIFNLLSWDVLKWIVLADVFAAPVSWYVASYWLDNFGKHITPGLLVFVLPLIVQCLIAVAVTSGVSLSVSRQNPVTLLRSE